VCKFYVGEYQETVRAKGNVQVYQLTEQDVAELLEYGPEKASLCLAATKHYNFIHKSHLAMQWCLFMQSLLLQNNPEQVTKGSDGVLVEIQQAFRTSSSGPRG
jgi:hypothetical protein